MLWPFLVCLVGALVPVVFGVDAFPITNMCDEHSTKDDCLRDCDCAWCLNTTQCYDVYGSDVDCDASVTRANSDHCKREARQEGLGILIAIAAGVCMAILFCGVIFLGAICAGIRKRSIYRGATKEECIELT